MSTMQETINALETQQRDLQTCFKQDGLLHKQTLTEKEFEATTLKETRSRLDENLKS